MKKWRRWRALSDPWLQGRLCLRVACYWTCCLLAVCVMLGWRLGMDAQVQNSREWWHAFQDRYSLVILLPYLILPFAIVDCIIYTNRIMGPLRRLRLAIRLAARGEMVEPIAFRKGDLLVGMDHEFNLIMERLRRAEGRGQRPASSVQRDLVQQEASA